jgi:hypothetical protein
MDYKEENAKRKKALRQVTVRYMKDGSPIVRRKVETEPTFTEKLRNERAKKNGVEPKKFHP